MAKRLFYEKYKDMVNIVSGPMKESTFQRTGKLTPQEFIEAGDALVQKIPAWQWAKGDAAVLPFLPPDKKYLLLRGATSKERADALLNPEGGDREAGDDWVATHADHVVAKTDVDVEKEQVQNWDSDEEEAAPVDADTVKEEVFRLYDLTIVYDQYYATPRMFLFGYNEKDHTLPLTANEMKEDIYSSNREKTVTVDPHPFLKMPSISIHPCRHAETLVRFLARMEERFRDEQEDLPEDKKVPFVFPSYFALFVFLKFISSVVPTISYDIAIDREM